jgi:HK97 family phage major capsid protein
MFQQQRAARFIRRQVSGFISTRPMRFVCCAARDLIDDAAVDVQSWVMDKISAGMSALVNEAILIGSGNGSRWDC